MSSAEIMACHECDLLQRIPIGQGVIRCSRCNAELLKISPGSFERTLAYTLAAVCLFIIANSFSIIQIQVGGNEQQTTLVGAARTLWTQGMPEIGMLVFVTTFLVPAGQLAAILYMMLPLRWGYLMPGARHVLSFWSHVQPWSMIEVFMLGVLVSVVKLASLAHVVPGVALWAFCGLVVAMPAVVSVMDPHDLWRRIMAPPAPATMAPLPATAAEAGWLVCHTCGLVSQPGKGGGHPHCPRCGEALHVRKRESVARTWALVIAAAILYIPANVLPVMNTSSLFGFERDTILSGVVYLWTSGDWPLAVLVFFASITVPVLKLIALTMLLISVQRRSTWQPQQRTKLYRLVEFVGRWSMLDIYVVTLMAALVQLQTLASITAGPGAVAFGAVVVLTMFAALAFDPRLIWDPMREKNG
ncbi:MAG TPA: paraquat-inducible protein A [Burkholderiaceae bacterium]|nr:paraquat-inducible protein A [Burkholderiaceae bacterium]